MKFTEDGTITVSTRVTGREVIVTVKDTGEGIDPKIQPRLFSKFATSSIQGTGLGILYLPKVSLKLMAVACGLRINVTEKAMLATFYFSLPCH